MAVASNAWLHFCYLFDTSKATGLHLGGCWKLQLWLGIQVGQGWSPSTWKAQYLSVPLSLQPQVQVGCHQDLQEAFSDKASKPQTTNWAAQSQMASHLRPTNRGAPSSHTLMDTASRKVTAGLLNIDLCKCRFEAVKGAN